MQEKKFYEEGEKNWNKSSLYKKWGWKKAGIMDVRGLMKEVDLTMHPDKKYTANLGKSKQWTETDSEKLAMFIRELINGAKL